MARKEIIEMSELDLIVENAQKIDLLIELLIEKNIFTKKEFDLKFEKIQN